jgi:N-glycosylase/DNA lyase
VLDTLWVPHGVYADRAARELRRNGVQHVYMTRSKYMPEASWNNLGRRMRAERQLQVVDSASTHYEEEELNYVEREIATRSRYFIAEARSTWSKTVVWSRNNSETFVQAIDLFEEHSSYGAAGV